MCAGCYSAPHTPAPGPAVPTRLAMPPKSKNLTKSQLYTMLADKTELTKVKVGELFDALEEIIRSELRTAGEIGALPGLLKIKKVDTPARPARPGRNPATGEAITIKAKPASKKVKVTLLKELKEMA